jgi:thioredoxin 1
LVVAALMVGLRLALGWLKKRGMNPVKNMKNILIVVLLIVAVGVVFAVKQRQAKPVAAEVEPGPAAAPAGPIVENPTELPRLVDLGADKCIPCKAMAPILEELKKTYAGQLQVDFIDVWKNPGAGDQYGLRVIPTQIFFSADGKELFRHEGFFSREDILSKWAECGVTLNSPGAP